MSQQEFEIALIGMVFVIVLLAGIFAYAWAETKRKERYKLQKEREQTLREMTAYVAEGSIAPDDAERLIRAMGETDRMFVGHGAGASSDAGSGVGAPRRPSTA